MKTQRREDDQVPTSMPCHSISLGELPASSREAANFEVLPSLPVQRVLHEVYFTCMFNAGLLFHRPTFTRAFEKQLVSKPSLLAIYASATMYISTLSLTLWLAHICM